MIQAGTAFERIEFFLRGLRDYFGAGRKKKRIVINDNAKLGHFLQTRASFVAQTSLYSYIRTRAGVRFPELFDEDGFNEKLNVAKWQVWLACLSDLSVFAGGLLIQRTGAAPERVGSVILHTFEAIIAATGTPPDAGEAFADGIARVRTRLAATDWPSVTDDDKFFSQSPEALVHWAPIVDDLKQYDAEIVKNSIRFRWQEVRRALRDDLDAGALMNAKGTIGPANS